MKWNHHPTHGFRFSSTDALAIALCAAFTIWGLREIGSTAWLFPFVLGHFFLFCNVFRVPRWPELVWAGCFITLATICLVLDVSFLNAMWMVLPITAGVLIYAVRLPTYHGIGSSTRVTQEEDKSRFKAIGPNASIHVICERHNSGEIAVCPKCGSDLVVAYNGEDARKYSGHPGIFCPSDEKHFQILFNIASPEASTDS